LSDDLISEYQSNKKKPSFIGKELLNKVLLSIIFFMLSTILIKSNDNIKKFYQEEIFTKQVEFTKINNLYNKYFGSILPTINTSTTEVFKENTDTIKTEKYLNGTKISLEENGTITVITSGIIVFLGDKDNLGKTCIVEGIDGIDIWYSNINIDNLTLYDYVTESNVLTNSLSNNVIITIDKDGTYLDYEEYTA